VKFRAGGYSRYHIDRRPKFLFLSNFLSVSFRQFLMAYTEDSLRPFRFKGAVSRDFDGPFMSLLQS
jgi:hypothetical protein